MAPYVPLTKDSSFHPTLVRSAPRTVTFGSFPMEPVSVVALILASQWRLFRTYSNCIFASSPSFFVTEPMEGGGDQVGTG
jgi:hypothetical protein